MSRKLASDIREKRRFGEQINIIEQGKEHFKKIMQIRKDEWVEEYQYWGK